MKKEEKKRRLLNFLDKKMFDPVINKSKNDFDSEDKKKQFEEVKRKTETEKERFHDYDGPEDIRTNFLRDLSSDPAKRVHSTLEYLDLPKLPDLKEDFLELYDDLNVKKS